MRRSSVEETIVDGYVDPDTSNLYSRKSGWSISSILYRGRWYDAPSRDYGDSVDVYRESESTSRHGFIIIPKRLIRKTGLIRFNSNPKKPNANS